MDVDVDVDDVSTRLEPQGDAIHLLLASSDVNVERGLGPEHHTGGMRS